MTAASGVAALNVKVASSSTGQRETPCWGSCTVTAGVVVAEVAAAAVQGSMIVLVIKLKRTVETTWIVISVKFGSTGGG